MTDFRNDPRIVLTLDAGGTNFVFSAMQGLKEVVEPVTLSAKCENLEAILKMILHGFEEVRGRITGLPSAISFAFPGPADYDNGIIGDLQNLPFFRGGVALGPMLENHFRVPVFINNDGDLFAYGEAIGGLLPEINRKLEEAGNPKRYQNLFGVTFGTGFGGGIVGRDGLFFGDNSAGGEINRMRNPQFPNWDVEESVSIRGVQREFVNLTGIRNIPVPEPKDIFEFGMGLKPGNQEASTGAFMAFARAAADAIANAITLIDGLVVIGGGLSGAWPLFLPELVRHMNEPFDTMSGEKLDRMEIKAYNLEDQSGLTAFLESGAREIKIPFSNGTVRYEPNKKTGIGISRLGTSQAVSIGAYAFALKKMD